MSWSVSASGKPAEVKAALETQFAYPLADGQSGLSDEGEKETVRRIKSAIEQTLDTFGADRDVTVCANGYMGYAVWDTKANPYQHVNLSIGLKP